MLIGEREWICGSCKALVFVFRVVRNRVGKLFVPKM